MGRRYYDCTWVGVPAGQSRRWQRGSDSLHRVARDIRDRSGPHVCENEGVMCRGPEGWASGVHSEKRRVWNGCTVGAVGPEGATEDWAGLVRLLA